MRVLTGLFLAALLVTGCGDERSATAPTQASPTLASSALYQRAGRLLEAVGVTDLVAAESLTGTWRGHEVVVEVTPTDEATFREPVLREYRVRDRAARVVDSPPYVFHRVNLGPLLWDVSVPDDEAAAQALVKALVDSQLPPEETPAELVANANHLYGARVHRTGDRFDVTSLWGIYCEHGGGCDPAVLVRQVGTDRSYEVGTYDELRSGLGFVPPGPQGPVRDGSPSAGAVALSDGRLLVLHASGEDRDGLWVGRGDDWSTYSPVPMPAGVAGLPTAIRSNADPDPVLWLETDAGQVLVSTDDGTTFRELALR